MLISTPSLGILGRTVGNGMLLPDVEGSPHRAAVPLHRLGGHDAGYGGIGAHLLHRDARCPAGHTGHLSLLDLQRNCDRGHGLRFRIEHGDVYPVQFDTGSIGTTTDDYRSLSVRCDWRS